MQTISKSLAVSIYLALFGGFLIIVLETIRRYHQMLDIEHFVNWFDDYLIGGCLIFAAYRVQKGDPRGQLLLSAAWGFAAGLMVLSFLGQLINLREPDPAPVPSGIVALIKGGLLAGAITGLVLTVKSPTNVQGKETE